MGASFHPGKPRLSKFYTSLSPQVQQSLLSRIFSLVSDRSSNLCNFLDAPDLRFPRIARPESSQRAQRRAAGGDNQRSKGRLAGGFEEYDEDEVSGSDLRENAWAAPSGTDRTGLASDGDDGDGDDEEDEDELRVIYRHYATLYFV